MVDIITNETQQNIKNLSGNVLSGQIGDLLNWKILIFRVCRL